MEEVIFDLNFKNEWNFKLACLSGLRFLQWLCGAVFQTEFKHLVDILASCGNQPHLFPIEKLQNTTKSFKFYQ